jgi:hypothetical protein
MEMLTSCVLRSLFGVKTKRVPFNLKERNKIKEGKVYLKDFI